MHLTPPPRGQTVLLNNTTTQNITAETGAFKNQTHLILRIKSQLNIRSVNQHSIKETKPRNNLVNIGKHTHE